MSSLTTRFKLPDSISDHISSDQEILPARVKEVILDKTHPEYKKYGGVDSIGVIKYSLIDQKIDTSDTTTLPCAYPLTNFSNTLPLVNEIVLLIQGPKFTNQDPNFKGKFSKRDYYIPSLGIFNDINYIPQVDELDSSDDDPGYGFEENPGIRPLHPFNGDTILQGRNGQSIRLTGALSPNNKFTDENNKNAPLTIITNGHQTAGSEELYIEDINKDRSSIYLTSDHTVPLKQSRDKYLSLDIKPTLADSYKGSQIILNSGRLFFNTHTDDIQFTSNTLLGITAENVIIEGKDAIGLDAKKIYLGEAARMETIEPVVLGTQLDILLQTLLNTLVATGASMKKARTIDQKIIPSINIQGAVLEEVTKQLINRIDLIKSKKVFTE